MAEELKDLLEKIKRDGIDAAEERARAIEAAAVIRADEKIRDAEREAERILSAARERIAKDESSGRESLKQASRNTLIALRQEIKATLERIVTAHVHKALGAEELSKAILVLVKEAGCGGRDKTIVTMRKEDLDKIEKPLMSELGSELKKGVILKHSAEIKGGFIISYDGGKSHYDFTDRALAEYIAASLKPQLAKILEESASG